MQYLWVLTVSAEENCYAPNKDEADCFCLDLFSLSDIMKTMEKRQVRHHDGEVDRLDIIKVSK